MSVDDENFKPWIRYIKSSTQFELSNLDHRDLHFNKEYIGPLNCEIIQSDFVSPQEVKRWRSMSLTQKLAHVQADFKILCDLISDETRVLSIDTKRSRSSMIVLPDHNLIFFKTTFYISP